MMPVVEMMGQHQVPGNVPAFIAKLWKMVGNTESDGLISWSEEGVSFYIKNQSEFARSQLPYYYKHSNMASFVRQLNMYGFRKVLSVEAGALKGEKEEMEFAHSFFIQGQEHLLHQIKRKVTTSVRSSPDFKQDFLPSSEKVNEVLTEMNQIRDRQEDMDGRLEAMKNENEALWGEVMSLRLRHSKQQKIVNKLIQFLVALVQPRGRKRSFQSRMGGGHLALEDTGVGAKLGKRPVGKEFEDIRVELSLQEAATDTQQQCGMAAAQLSQTDALAQVPGVAVEDVTEFVYTLDPLSVTLPQVQGETQLSLTPTRVRTPVVYRENLDMDDISMQELDSLKDLMTGQFLVDTSLVADLFGQDLDISTSNLFSDTLVDLEVEAEKEAEAVKRNLITYSPGKLGPGLPQENDPDLYAASDHDYADPDREDSLGLLY